MSASKMSRNRQRKTAYAAQADKSSRNEVVIEGPIVGHFEAVTVTKDCFCVRVDEEGGGSGPDPKCRKCGGTGARPVTDALGKPKQIERIVHERRTSSAPTDATASTAVSHASREATERKRRRQEAAWERCRTKTASGKHDLKDNNCRCCGCPASASRANEEG